VKYHIILSYFNAAGPRLKYCTEYCTSCASCAHSIDNEICSFDRKVSCYWNFPATKMSNHHCRHVRNCWKWELQRNFAATRLTTSWTGCTSQCQPNVITRS